MYRDQLADYILGMIPLIHRKLIKKHCINTELPMHQIGLLHILAHHSGNPINFYCDKMSISRPNMTKLVNQLINKNYVSREHDSNDRRVINLYITEKGRTVLKANYLTLKKQTCENIKSLSDEDVLILIENFKQIKKIFQKLDNHPKCKEVNHDKIT